MSKFPKTIAAIQRRDRSQWEIGDALLAETDVGGSHDELQEVAEELEHQKIEGYSIEHLRKLRATSHNFPSRARETSISWDAHKHAGSPEMLETIVKSAGSKPVTRDLVRSMKPVIEQHQERKYKEENPGKPLPKRGEMPAPSAKEVRGLALQAEMLRYNSKILGCRGEMEDVAEWLEKNLEKLTSIEVDYLVETMLSLVEETRRITEMARKLKAGRRAHLSVVGD